ncbi:hypothetical protein [Pseudoduganella guangdongensis]|uniref:hypothetical protein n=1 Tax=Pseudoduganella guangdongensis TaxID=2692179 RepID=UPI001E3FC615|nr:hypothetical protein [Pseudoduganella guangdongensis]
MGAGVRSGLPARRPVPAVRRLGWAAALCGALLPAAAPAAPWAGVLPLPSLAAAADATVAAAAVADAAVAGVAVAAAVAAPAPAGADKTVRDEKLEQMRGGSDTPWSDMKLAGTVANNSAVNVVTGSNIVTDSAFSNASGLPMVIQNSGANVLIQNATIINVQIK